MHKNEEIRNGVYFIGTPIGNLGDLTYRAHKVLCAADVVVCEDTRVTRKLLSAYQIKPSRVITYNDYSGNLEEFLGIARRGVLAVCCDAGMPGISDPGYTLVQRLYLADAVDVYWSCIPGPSALTTALSLAGFPVDRVVFLGFLHRKETAIKEQLAPFKEQRVTIVFFESPRRLLLNLEVLRSCMSGERMLCVIHEMTKMYERFYTRTIDQHIAFYKEKIGHPKGEVTVVCAPYSGHIVHNTLDEAILQAAMEYLPISKAACMLAKMYGRDKQELYRQMLRMKKAPQTG